MIRPAALLALAAVLLASACDRSPEPSASPTGDAVAPSVPQVEEAPPQVSDFPELRNRDCLAVVRFYLDSIAVGEFGRAALVWNDPTIDGARLAALFAGYTAPRIEPGQPEVEGAAGSLFCTVSGTLTDTANPATPPFDGELVLRRVNDVPGATPDQLRWTLRSSTFVAPLERSTAN